VEAELLRLAADVASEPEEKPINLAGPTDAGNMGTSPSEPNPALGLIRRIDLPADLQDMAASDPHGTPFQGWQHRPDVQGRLGLERPGLADHERWRGEYDLDDLPKADWTCPRCGSLLWWEDLAGRRHCLQCEREDFERSERLAEKAARLRRKVKRAI
jgi:hypothetical protein